MLGLPVNRNRGIRVEDLKKVMQICDAYCINRETWKRCLAAYTLLSCCTLVSPRAANANMPDELLRCMQNPVEIGEYDWAGYILDVLRASAERFQQEMNEGAPSLTSGGSNLFLQVCAWFT